MLRLRTLGVVVAAAFAAGCATLTVSSHVERGIDFARFATYDWGPADTLPTGDPRLDNNPFFIDYLTGAVERELATRGYRHDEAAPQLLIHYHANVSQRFDVHGIDRNAYAACHPNCEPELVEYEQGTIIVDVVETATGKLIWRGWAQDNVKGLLDTQDGMQEQIERSVQRMFRLFPRGVAGTAADR